MDLCGRGSDVLGLGVGFDGRLVPKYRRRLVLWMAIEHVLKTRRCSGPGFMKIVGRLTHQALRRPTLSVFRAAYLFSRKSSMPAAGLVRHGASRASLGSVCPRLARLRFDGTLEPHRFHVRCLTLGRRSMGVCYWLPPLDAVVEAGRWQELWRFRDPQRVGARQRAGVESESPRNCHRPPPLGVLQASLAPLVLPGLPGSALFAQWRAGASYPASHAWRREL